MSIRKENRIMKRTYKYGKLLNNELKDPEFRKEYEDLEEEFEIAEEVIKLRLKAGLTQKALAEKAKTSQPTIARLESGRYRNVSLSFLKRIGRALGATPQVHFRRYVKKVK